MRATMTVAALVTCGAAACAAEDAAVVFRDNCLPCHGADGRARTFAGKKAKAADLTAAAVQSLDDAALAAVVTKGRGKMPAFGGKLSPEQIRALVQYVRQFGGAH